MFFLHILILYHLLEEVIFTLYYFYTTTNALIYSTRRQANETTYDVTPYTADQALDKAKLDAPPSTVKGIDAIRLMSEGYTCREIGEQIGATDKQVAAMVSKARKFLKSRKDILDLAGNI